MTDEDSTDFIPRHSRTEVIPAVVKPKPFIVQELMANKPWVALILAVGVIVGISVYEVHKPPPRTASPTVTPSLRSTSPTVTSTPVAPYFPKRKRTHIPAQIHTALKPSKPATHRPTSIPHPTTPPTHVRPTPPPTITPPSHSVHPTGSSS